MESLLKIKSSKMRSSNCDKYENYIDAWCINIWWSKLHEAINNDFMEGKYIGRELGNNVSRLKSGKKITIGRKQPFFAKRCTKKVVAIGREKTKSWNLDVTFGGNFLNKIECPFFFAAFLYLFLKG